MSLIGQVTAYGRFAVGLRRFLRESITAELGREMLRERLRNRERNFLTLMKRAVYENETSPYLSLLRIAACEFGDLERMVASHGIESALSDLRDAGVYLTIDEFKCRETIVRGSTVTQCEPGDFNNPFLMKSITTSSSGTRSTGTSSTVNLERSLHSSLCHAVSFSAHGISGGPTLLWMPILPSAAGLGMLLQSSKMGVPPVKWYSPVAARAVRPSLVNRLATLYIVYAGRLFGTRMPAPAYVAGDQVYKVVDALLDVVHHEKKCVVFSTPSSAVRACQDVRSRGLDIPGVKFVTSGEPLTPAKLSEITSVGAGAVNLYAYAEGGIVGFGCADKAKVGDDIHVLTGAHAVISRQRQTDLQGGTVNAYLFTSLLEKAPKILLNAENGDFGALETRECGCEWGALGFTQHLHAIHSFDKLTGEGMTFVGTDLVRIMEELVPSRFGGASTDYQVVEYEDTLGRSKLDVVISPSVGDVDESEVIRLILSELGRGSDTNRMMAEVWRQGGILGVRRDQPYLTAGGKMLPLHVLKARRNGV